MPERHMGISDRRHAWTYDAQGNWTSWSCFVELKDGTTATVAHVDRYITYGDVTKSAPPEEATLKSGWAFLNTSKIAPPNPL